MPWILTPISSWDYLRMGPFDSPDIQVQGGQATVEKIQGRYFAYVKLT